MDRIGRYPILSELGGGAIGRVYLAHDPALDRPLAVKLMNRSRAEDPEIVARFEREAQAASALNHRNIAVIYECGEHQGQPYIAMEYLGGRDLATCIADPVDLTLAQKLSVFTQVAEALAAAHAHGIVHRDIKPANIRLLDDGLVKVMDFGVSRIASSTPTSGGVYGRAAYASPEQLHGAALDGRSNLYSLGVVAYELVARERPYRGATDAALVLAVIEGTPPPLTALRRTPYAWLEEVILRCLEKDPEARFQSGEELVEALRGGLDMMRLGLGGRSHAATEAEADREETLNLGNRPDATVRYFDATDEGGPAGLVSRFDAKPAAFSTGLRPEPLDPEAPAEDEHTDTFMLKPSIMSAPTVLLDQPPALPEPPPVPVPDPPPVPPPPRRVLVIAAIVALAAVGVVGAILAPRLHGLASRRAATPTPVAASPSPPPAPEATVTPPAASPAPAPAVAAEVPGEVARLVAEGQAFAARNAWTEPAGACAIDRFRAALELDPANGEALAGVQAAHDMLVKRGEELLKAGDFKSARVRFQKAGTVVPASAAAKDGLARVARAEHDAAERRAAATADAWRAAQERGTAAAVEAFLHDYADAPSELRSAAEALRAERTRRESAPTPAPTPAPLTAVKWHVAHDHAFGSCVGVLVADERGLRYESSDKPADNQSWAWREVKGYDVDGVVSTVLVREGAKQKKHKFKLVDGALPAEVQSFLDRHIAP